MCADALVPRCPKTMWRGRGVLARRSVPRGAASRAFSLPELAAAIDHPPHQHVYVEPDATGALWSRAGAAALAVRARLAPSAAARAAELSAELSAEPRGAALTLRLRLVADVPPLHELLLWPDAATLAALDMPFLTPLNITGSESYTCHKCQAEFEYPNPLKIHLFLGCREYTVVDFWRHCLAKFEQMTKELSQMSSQIREHTVSRRAALPPRRAPPALAAAAASPAALEALAAAWGRSREGHVCVYCGKLYSRKYGLKIHIRTHTGYKPLRCRHCLRAFGDPSNLNKHVRLHARTPSRGRTAFTSI